MLIIIKICRKMFKKLNRIRRLNNNRNNRSKIMYIMQTKTTITMHRSYQFHSLLSLGLLSTNLSSLQKVDQTSIHWIIIRIHIKGWFHQKLILMISFKIISITNQTEILQKKIYAFQNQIFINNKMHKITKVCTI